MAKRKRRIRSPHPGVKLKRRALPSGRTGWRAHFVDPDTDREVAVTLDPVALPTHEARTRWAVNKSRQLAKIKMDRAAGIAPAPVGLPIEKAVAEYLEAARIRLRPRTLQVYGTAFARLEEWASAERVERTTDLTRARLASLHEHLVKAPKNARRGGERAAKRGKKRRASYRSSVTVNTELRALKTLIGAWRKRDLTPQLSRDDISDALAALPVDRDQPVFLAPAALRKLLEAATQHDAACFAETREEHAGRRPRGTTPRYVPIAPFVAFVMLTGCRRNEALSLRWDVVDLDAVDHEGRKVGEIRLGAQSTKTRRARTIGLEVSPALRRVLAAMKEHDGSGHVFGGAEPYTLDLVETARRRLMREYGAPTFDWQTLRSTCATYLTNAPGIFGAATVFLSAKQLGHSVAVAERHYLGVHRGIPRDAHTLEAAMQIEVEIGRPL